MTIPANHRFISTSSILLMLCLLPVVSMAQQYYDPGLMQKTIDSTPQEYKAPGVRVGSFLLQPGAELVYENNSNIFYLDNNEIGDSIFHVRPWLNVLSDWSRHMLNFKAFADFGKYSKFDTEDYTDWRLSLDGRFDVRRNSALSVSTAYMHLHEDRSSPDDLGGIRPTEFDYSGFDVGYGHTFNRLTAKINYNKYKTDYDNNVRLDGEVLNNQDRNRTREAYGLRLDYGLSSGKTAVFFGFGKNNIDYDQNPDDDGNLRSSDGYAYQVGVVYTISNLLAGELYATYVTQDYDDPSFNDVSGWGLGGALNWSPTEVTNVNFRFDTAPQETTQVGSSGYFSTLYAVRVQHELRRNLLANARVSYTNNKYETNDGGPTSLAKTDVWRAGLGITYLINRYLYVSGGYSVARQSANLSFYEYSTNYWFVTLGGEL